MKVWAKAKKIDKEGTLIPVNVNVATAVQGFLQMGVEVILYEKLAEILQWVTRDDIVVSFIGDVDRTLAKFGVEAPSINYPDELKEHLGRRVWTDTLYSIYNDRSKWGVFVKPTEEKLFVGRVVNSLADLMGCGSEDDIEVVCSDPIDIKAEWRCFVKYDEILDIRPYGFSTDFNYHYDYAVVKEILKAFTECVDRPMGCSIDICVTADNKTLVVEVNDGYALASYGLDSLHYAKLISARWSQLLDRPDEFNFI